MQKYKITGYNVPWAGTPTARPVFTSLGALASYLNYCATGYTFTTGADTFFHEKQDSVILHLPTLTAHDISLLRRNNYLKKVY